MSEGQPDGSLGMVAKAATVALAHASGSFTHPAPAPKNWRPLANARKLLAMIFLALLLSFLIGSIPFGVLLGKMRGVDVRAVGSGNIGATNVWRALGPTFGVLSFALDMMKGWAGPIVGGFLLAGNTWGIAACGIASVLGHIFSPFLGFKGGKGISTSLGALFGLMPWVGVIIFAFWGVVLAFSRMISLASVAACVGLPFLALLLHAPRPYVLVASLMSLFALVKHIPNLRRIAAGTEPKIGAKKVEVNG